MLVSSCEYLVWNCSPYIYLLQQIYRHVFCKFKNKELQKAASMPQYKMFSEGKKMKENLQTACLWLEECKHASILFNSVILWHNLWCVWWAGFLFIFHYRSSLLSAGELAAGSNQNHLTASISFKENDIQLQNSKMTLIHCTILCISMKNMFSLRDI